MQQPSFARVLAAPLPQGPVFAEAFLPMQLVGEAFGPPEISDRQAHWIFADTTGKPSYAIVTDPLHGRQSVEMQFIASTRRGAEFFGWVMAKINRTENGDIAPAFLCTQRMALRVERL